MPPPRALARADRPRPGLHPPGGVRREGRAAALGRCRPRRRAAGRDAARPRGAGRDAGGVPPGLAASGRARPGPPRRGRRRGRRAQRPGRRHPRGRPGRGQAAGRRGRRPGAAGGRRDGQVRRARAQLRLRRRRHLRLRAGRGPRPRPGRPGQPGRHAAGRPPDACLRRPHRRGRHLARRRQPAPRGSQRPARADPGEPPRLLRALGQHLGVPGPAQGQARRRRPRPRARLRRDGAADGVGRGRARGVRRGHPGHASPRHRAHPVQGGRAAAEAGLGRPARRGVRRAAAADGARPHRRPDPVADHALGAGRPHRARLHRPRGRPGAARLLLLPAHPRAPHAAAPAAAHPRGARRRGGAAPPGPLDGLPQAVGGVAEGPVGSPPPRGAAPAPEALLPSAALGRRPHPRRGGQAEPRGRARPARRPRLRRSLGGPAAPGVPHHGRLPRCSHPAHAAAGDARVVRRGPRPRRRALRLPPDQRGDGQHPVVPRHAARRGGGRATDGPPAGDLALRHRAARA